MDALAFRTLGNYESNLNLIDGSTWKSIPLLSTFQYTWIPEWIRAPCRPDKNPPRQNRWPLLRQCYDALPSREMVYTQFLSLIKSSTGLIASLPAWSVWNEPTITSFCFALENATFSLRKSCKSLPDLPSWLLRTRERMITGLSLPWNTSTVPSSSPFFFNLVMAEFSFSTRSY